MNLRKFTTRAVVAGATTALAAGALVGVTSTTANATTVSNNYSCDMPGLVTFATAVTVTGELPLPYYWAGATVPAGIVAPITVSATVPSAIASALGGAGVTGAKSDDYALTLGTESAPFPVAGGFETTDGSTTWEATGSNADFVTGDPGVVDGFLPTTFTMVATKADGSSFGSPLTCTLTDEAPAEIVTDFELMKQSSATTAKAVKVKKGKKAVLPVTVVSTSLSGSPVSGGKVTAKEGSKTLATGTLKNGVVKLNLGKKLKVGKHKVTVTYAGIPSVGGSKDKTTVTVKK
jgi:hypothetical protein